MIPGTYHVITHPIHIVENWTKHIINLLNKQQNLDTLKNYYHTDLLDSNLWKENIQIQLRKSLHTKQNAIEKSFCKICLILTRKCNFHIAVIAWQFDWRWLRSVQGQTKNYSFSTLQNALYSHNWGDMLNTRWCATQIWIGTIEMECCTTIRKFVLVYTHIFMITKGQCLTTEMLHCKSYKIDLMIDMNMMSLNPNWCDIANIV